MTLSQVRWSLIHFSQSMAFSISDHRGSVRQRKGRWLRVSATPAHERPGERGRCSALGHVLVEFTRYGMEGSPSLARSQLVLSPVIHLRRPGVAWFDGLLGGGEVSCSANLGRWMFACRG